jgi:hypothetical protein
VLPDDEVVYMDAIPGFPLPKGKCLRLLRTLYGLVQLRTLTTLADLKVIPEVERVYPDCPHDVAVVNILLYVDNTGVRSNCPTLVQQFHANVRTEGRIDLNFTGNLSWFIGCGTLMGTMDLCLVISSITLRLWLKLGFWRGVKLLQ